MKALRTRLSRMSPEYFCCGWTLVMVGALAQINDGLAALGVSP